MSQEVHILGLHILSNGLSLHFRVFARLSIEVSKSGHLDETSRSALREDSNVASE